MTLQENNTKTEQEKKALLPNKNAEYDANQVKQKTLFIHRNIPPEDPNAEYIKPTKGGNLKGFSARNGKIQRNAKWNALAAQKQNTYYLESCEQAQSLKFAIQRLGFISIIRRTTKGYRVLKLRLVTYE